MIVQASLWQVAWFLFSYDEKGKIIYSCLFGSVVKNSLDYFGTWYKIDI